MTSELENPYKRDFKQQQKRGYNCKMVLYLLLNVNSWDNPKWIIIWMMGIQKGLPFVSSAAAVSRAGLGCKTYQFIQNGPEHRVVTRRCGIQSLRNPSESKESCGGKWQQIQVIGIWIVMILKHGQFKGTEWISPWWRVTDRDIRGLGKFVLYRSTAAYG